MNNYLSRSVPEVQQQAAGTLSNQQTTNHKSRTESSRYFRRTALSKDGLQNDKSRN